MLEPESGDYLGEAADALLRRPRIWLGLGLLTVVPALDLVVLLPQDPGDSTGGWSWVAGFFLAVFGSPAHPELATLEEVGRRVANHPGSTLIAVVLQSLWLVGNAIFIRAALARDASDSVDLREPALADPRAILRFVGVAWLQLALGSLVVLRAIMVESFGLGAVALAALALLYTRLLLVPTLVAGGATLGEALQQSWWATSGRAGKTLGLVGLLLFVGIGWSLITRGIGPLLSSEPLALAAWAVVSGVPVVALTRLSLVSATQNLVASARPGRSLLELRSPDYLTEAADVLIRRPRLWLGLGVIAALPLFLGTAALAGTRAIPTPSGVVTWEFGPLRGTVNWNGANRDEQSGAGESETLRSSLDEAAQHPGAAAALLLFHALWLIAGAWFIRAALARDPQDGVRFRDPSLADPVVMVRYVVACWLLVTVVVAPWIGAILLNSLLLLLLAATMWTLVWTRLLPVGTLIARGATIAEAFRDSWQITRGRVAHLVVPGMAYGFLVWDLPWRGLLVRPDWSLLGLMVAAVPLVVMGRLAIVTLTCSLFPWARMWAPAPARSSSRFPCATPEA